MADDFEAKALPELQHRIKVNLKTRWVQALDHRGSGQLLYFKERFLASGHPQLAEMLAFSAKLRNIGITGQVGVGPTKVSSARVTCIERELGLESCWRLPSLP